MRRPPSPPVPCRNSTCFEAPIPRKRAPQRGQPLTPGNRFGIIICTLRPTRSVIRSITQEVEEVALESLQPAGRFVRRQWRDGGIFQGYASGFYPLILHRNLAFFRKACKAVLEKLNMEMYSRGRKREHSKCFRSRERRVGSTPTISARKRVLLFKNAGSFFLFISLKVGNLLLESPGERRCIPK